ncbi:hypothetical protein [Raoultibacter timonensis]|uniref:hypothetical protein n=1 Tax=Raoultibacter timonensis TaxID=1907662 RepID=UPI001FCAA023|nr:hypothetical protein [Raoultibacter timonensis]
MRNVYSIGISVFEHPMESAVDRCKVDAACHAGYGAAQRYGAYDVQRRCVLQPRYDCNKRAGEQGAEQQASQCGPEEAPNETERFAHPDRYCEKSEGERPALEKVEKGFLVVSRGSAFGRE